MIIEQLPPEDARWWRDTLAALLEDRTVLSIVTSNDHEFPRTGQKPVPVKAVYLRGDTVAIQMGQHGGLWCGCADIEIDCDARSVFVRKNFPGKEWCVWTFKVIDCPDDCLEYIEEETRAWRTADDEQWAHQPETVGVAG